MEKITVVREISCCALLLKVRQIASGSTLEISRFSGGRFGTLYRCTSVDERKCIPFVVKLLRLGQTSGPGSRAVADLHSAIAKQAATFPTGWEVLLRGVPFWIGEVKLQNELVIALVCLDLEPLGFMQFDRVLEEKWKQYCSLALAKRVKLAMSFARGYAILEQLRFLHADINTENIFVNLETCEALLIDFDAGVLRAKGDEVPLTPGKPNEFLAPELKNATGADISKYNEATELWAVGFMVHTLIFGIHPLFFLSQLSQSVLQEYLHRHKWPEIGLYSTLAHTKSRQKALYFYWHFKHHDLHDLEKLRPDAFATLQKFINNGALAPENRPPGRDWMLSLTEAAMTKQEGAKQRCSFCGKGRESVWKILGQSGSFICSECVGLFGQVLAGSREKLVYESDFSQPSKWREWTDDEVKVFRQDGFYCMTFLKPPDIDYQCIVDASGTDLKVIVEADFDTRLGSDGFYGLVLRSDLAGSHYSFQIHRSGEFRLFSQLKGERHVLINWTPSELIKKERVCANALMMKAAGKSITVGVNGQALATINDYRPGIESGCVGVCAGTRYKDTVARVRFRNFRVYEFEG